MSDTVINPVATGSLDDKYNVCETVYRFAHGVDTRDWDLHRSIFTDAVTVDSSSYEADLPLMTVWTPAPRRGNRSRPATEQPGQVPASPRPLGPAVNP